MNYQNLLNKKPRYNFKFILVLLIVIIILVYIINLKIFDVLNLKGIVSNDIMILNILADDSDTIINGKYLIINNKKYKYKVVKINPIEMDEKNYIMYQRLELEIAKKLRDNEIVNLTFYYNEKKIKEKIKMLILGKEN